MNLNMYTPVNLDGSIRDDLAAFLRLFGIDPTLPIRQLAEQTMDKWVIRDSERWEQPELILDDDAKAERFWALIKTLPFYYEQAPTANSFNHALFVGGTLPPQDRKNAFGVKLWNNGVRFGTVALLGGDRATNDTSEALSAYSEVRPGGLPVDPSWNGLTVKPATEADMMRELWRRSEMPAEMRALPTTYISATASGGRQRANFDDACEAWLATDPTPGTVLGITVRPHDAFQHWKFVQNLERRGFTVTMAAATAELGPQRPDYFTHSVANWLHCYVNANG